MLANESHPKRNRAPDFYDGNARLTPRERAGHEQGGAKANKAKGDAFELVRVHIGMLMTPFSFLRSDRTWL